MGTVFKRTATKPLPVGAEFVVRKGQRLAKWQDAKGAFVPSKTRGDVVEAIQPTSTERRVVDAAIECINCGVCYAACDTVRWNEDYLGPAALNRAWTLANDVRDVQQKERLLAVSGDAGCHACHTQGSCSERCPKQIEPTAGIAGLKRLAARAAVMGELG